MHKSLALRTIWLALLTTVLLCFPAQSHAIDWNFESGTLDGWTTSGPAFVHQPTKGNNINARSASYNFNPQGNYFIGSFEYHHDESTYPGNFQGNGPTGRLTSDLFTLYGTQISFLIGGTQDSISEYVSLLIKATPENQRRFTVDPRDPDTGVSIPYPTVGYGGETYYEVMRATGRNVETMYRFSINVAPYVHSGDQARVQIADLSGGGHINVDDFTFATRPRSVCVKDEYEHPVKDAEVFVNGRGLGVTDIEGYCDARYVNPGDMLVARKMIREEGTYRPEHGNGSIRNWKYRVYLTSMEVYASGEAPQQAAGRSGVAMDVLYLRRTNTLIGMNVVASYEWDLSPDEVRSLTNDWSAASQFLYNATDGQFFFEQVAIHGSQRAWDDADYHVNGNNQMRAHTDIPFGWWQPSPGVAPGLIQMPRPGGWAYNPQILVHEFGHYGFGLFDEYADGLDYIKCSTQVDTAGPFQHNMPKSSCIMWDQQDTFKFCSSRPENLHNWGTIQGFFHSHDCWQSIMDTYSASSLGLGELYTLRSPATRGLIPGTLAPLPIGWLPRVQTDAAFAVNYIGTIPFTVRDSSGAPRSGVHFTLHQADGRDINEGNTDTEGRINVVGCHNYDIVRYDGREVMLNPAVLLASTDQKGFFTQGKSRDMELTLNSDAPKIVISAEIQPGNSMPHLRIRSTSGSIKDPIVTFKTALGKNPTGLKVFLDEKEGLWQADLPVPTGTETTVDVLAVIGDEKLLESQTFRTTSAPKDGAAFHTVNGQFEVSAPDGTFAEGTAVLVCESAVKEPSLAPGEVIVAGPYSATATDLPKPSEKFPMALRFLLTVSNRPKPAYDGKAFRIMRLLPGGAWQDVPGVVFSPETNLVSVRVPEIGTYALIGKRS